MQRVQPRLYKGFRDIFPSYLKTRWHIINKVKEVYERYGFMPIDTPAIEYVDTLGKFLPESQTPEGGIYAFKNENDEWIALRYDLTAPLSRVVAQYQDLKRPFRRYQYGPVWRFEKPGPDRFREFYQMDFDSVGASSLAADAEVSMVMCDALENLGIEPGKYIIRINNRKILSGVLEKAKIGQLSIHQEDSQAMTVLRAIDKLDRVGLDGVRELLQKGRMDQSGDFTKGANLETKQIDLILSFLSITAKNRNDVLTQLSDLVTGSEIGETGLEELSTINQVLTALDYNENRVIIDPTIVRGLSYYTGPVVEGILTFPIVDEKGKERSFGSVFGGGRYDDLIKRFTGQEIPATGGSIGVDRLAAALEFLGKTQGNETTSQVLITTMDKSKIPQYHIIAARLRKAGINTEVYVAGGNIKKQLKYADQRNIPLALIAGEDEFSKNVIQLKDLRLGKELADSITERNEWLKSQPAQQEVSIDELTQIIKKRLQ